MVSLAMFYIWVIFKTSNQQDAIQSINTLRLCQPVYGSQFQAHILFMKMIKCQPVHIRKPYTVGWR